MNVETLTEFGIIWAEANAPESMVARVALAGYSSGWPTSHVETAIRSCNQNGAETAGCDA